jgi:hypothetical protein
MPRRRESLADTGIWLRIGGASAGIVGHVTAADAQKTVAKAIEELDMPASDRKSLIARSIASASAAPEQDIQLVRSSPDA